MIKKNPPGFADTRSAEVFFDALFSLYDLRGKKFLDAFARAGDLTASNLAKRTTRNQLHCWELGAEHQEALEHFSAHVQIGCSYGFLRECEETFDLIVIDTPQGIHIDQNRQNRVEHFGFLLDCAKLVDKKAVIALYVNKRPYKKDIVGHHGQDQYDFDHDTWMRVRSKFYGCAEIDESIAMEVYSDRLLAEGLKVTSVLSMPCFSDVPGLPPYGFRLALEVEKV